MNIIETTNLTKDYTARFTNQNVRALNDFTFSINEGEIFGLLGPNGAGKTTLIKILLGITFPTLGNVKVFGKEPSDHTWKSKVGYLPENHRYPNYLTGEQVLSYYGRLSGLKNGPEFQKKIDGLLETMDLNKWKKIKIRKYSKGMLQKLGLAQALINEPDLIFLDEPTDGVDPIGRKVIRDILLELKQKGKTIFLNSHQLLEVEVICDRVAILNKGELVKEGTIDDLTKITDLYVIETRDPITIELKQKILAIDQLAGVGDFELQTDTGLETTNRIIDTLRESGINIKSLHQKTYTLEESFISVIKGGKPQ